MTVSAPAKSGYIAKATFGSLPIFIHWTFPFTGLLLTLFLGKFALATFAPALCAYVLLILIHELGHASFASLAGLKVHAIAVTGLGGWCFADPPHTFRQAFLFYAGGLLFQAAALALAITLLLIFGNPKSTWFGAFAFVFTFYNAAMLIGNAIPSRNNDGARIWALIRSR